MGLSNKTKGRNLAHIKDDDEVKLYLSDQNIPTVPIALGSTTSSFTCSKSIVNTNYLVGFGQENFPLPNCSNPSNPPSTQNTFWPLSPLATPTPSTPTSPPAPPAPPPPPPPPPQPPILPIQPFSSRPIGSISPSLFSKPKTSLTPLDLSKTNMISESFEEYKSPSHHIPPSPSWEIPSMDKCFKLKNAQNPGKKLKNIHWAKVSNQLVGKSFWAKCFSPLACIDYSTIEEWFCIARSRSLPTDIRVNARMKKITLLDNKRSLAVNIFLKQLKQGTSAVIGAVHTCDSTGLTAEHLRRLLEILPDEQEVLVSLMNSFSGDQTFLDTADRFFLDLVKIPDYTLRAQAMLQNEEFPVKVTETTSQAEAIIEMCYSLINNSHLAKFLRLLLLMGNYLNAGSYAGNAAGFKLNTLPKILDTPANKSRMTFLHLAVEVAKTQRSDMLAFTEDGSKLHILARNPLASIQEETVLLAKSVRELDTRVKASKSKDILPKFKEFLKQASKDVETLEGLMERAKAAERSLAEHFCEDPNKFQLEECFALLADFFSKVQQAIIAASYVGVGSGQSGGSVENSACSLRPNLRAVVALDDPDAHDIELRKRQEEKAVLQLEAGKKSSIANNLVPKKMFNKLENQSELADILTSDMGLGDRFKLRRDSCHK